MMQPKKVDQDVNAYIMNQRLSLSSAACRLFSTYEFKRDFTDIRQDKILLSSFVSTNKKCRRSKRFGHAVFLLTKTLIPVVSVGKFWEYNYI